MSKTRSGSEWAANWAPGKEGFPLADSLHHRLISLVPPAPSETRALSFDATGSSVSATAPRHGPLAEDHCFHLAGGVGGGELGGGGAFGSEGGSALFSWSL